MLAELIKKRMAELDRTQAETARKSGLSTGHVSDLVNGRKGTEVSMPTLLALATGLDVEPSYFFSATHTHKQVNTVTQRTRKRVGEGMQGA